MGSRGSVLPIFIDQIKSEQKITITDPAMTRFNITMNQALELVFRALKNGIGGEIFVPKLKAYRLDDFKNAVLELLKSETETKLIPVRSGEKYHESLISKEEIRNTYEDKEDYIVFQQQSQEDPDFNKTKNLPKVKIKDEYSSDKAELLTKEELKKILLNENLITDIK